MTMNEKYEVVRVKDAFHYVTLRDFKLHAFYCDSPEAHQRFGDAVYFIEIEWKEQAIKAIYGW